MKKAVFAGTFDPFTVGHYEIALRAAKLFDSLVIAVADSPSSRAVASIDKRLEIVERSVCEMANVSVKPFGGLLVDFAESVGAEILVRGLRNTTDFVYEKDIGQVYKGQNKAIECVYLISDPSLAHVSASIVREIAAFDGNISDFVCAAAIDCVRSYYGKQC